MRPVLAVVIIAIIPRLVHADPELIRLTPSPPPSHRGAHRELIAALALSVTAVSLGILGGVLAGSRDSFGPDAGDQAWRAGLGLGIIGAVAAPPALHLLTYGLAHDKALRRYTLPPVADAALAESLLASIDGADRNAVMQEKIGMGLFFAGIGLCVGGALLATLGGLDGASLDEGGIGGNSGALISGIAISVAGDAGIVSGWLLWAHAAGTRRGLKEARASISVSAGGFNGTF